MVMCRFKRHAVKNLSVNNVDVQLDLSEGNDRRRQGVEGKKAAIQLFVSHQQFAEAVEPTVRHLNDPAPGFLFGITFEFICLLSPSFDMVYEAVLFDDFQCRRSGVAGVGAQVLVTSVRRVGSWENDGFEHRLQL